MGTVRATRSTSESSNQRRRASLTGGSRSNTGSGSCSSSAKIVEVSATSEDSVQGAAVSRGAEWRAAERLIAYGGNFMRTGHFLAAAFVLACLMGSGTVPVRAQEERADLAKIAAA